MNRLALAAIALAASLLPGCSLLLPPKPEPVKAILSEVPNDLPHERRHAASLLILTPETSPAYDTTRMAYSVKLYQIAYFRDNEWAETPAQMIQPLLVQTLQRTGLFRAILTPPETGRTDYTLRTNIVNLVQDYTVNPPVLRLAFRLQLLGASGRLIAGREITVQETMRDATPYAGVIAANDAVGKALRIAAGFVLNSVR
ncbi:MAG TPA: ABC-type transport auxiliary lipoprotein family protein [Acetobacteraceae bacterium]|nr:ABC-type transport auxiliary lipoprotein family protein [Acetobacteraceae bacterium]